MPQTNSLTASQKKVIIISSLGGALEFYDFIVYAFAAEILAKLFFPVNDPLWSLMLAFAAMAISYLVRPLGGIIFSHFGDTRGRKQVFLISIILMAVPTMLIGFLPTYASIGLIAPVLLVSLRILQGLAVGGEIPGTLTFVLEHVSFKHRGFACACIFASINFGLLLGQAVVVFLQTLLTDTQYSAWGWRIGFYLGGLLGVVGVYVRTQLSETPAFLAYKKASGTPPPFPLKTLFAHHFPALLQSTLIALLLSVQVSLVFVFLPSYINTAQLSSYPASTIHLLNGISILILTISLLFMGWLIDQIGRYRFMITSTAVFIVIAYPLYTLALTGTLTGLVVGLFGLSLICSATIACIPYLVAELFPTAIRFTGTALSYNTAQALFGGTAPLAATYLVKSTTFPQTPAAYLIGCGFLALLGTVWASRQNRQEKNDFDTVMK